jgi:hypothetical protein
LALEECLKIEPENATIHFELGKILALKTIKAYSSFERATQIDPQTNGFG